MQRFAELFIRVDQSNKTNEKLDALTDYFRDAPEEDRLWAVAILSHRRPKRTVNTTLLRRWAAERSGIPDWLFEDTYHIVGDLAETIALALPPPAGQQEESLKYWIDYIRALENLEEADKKQAVLQAWDRLESSQRFIFNKFITGNWRVGVSDKLVVKALSRLTALKENIIAHRLTGNWSPDTTTFRQLVLDESPDDDLSKPYPFYLAYPLEENAGSLGTPGEWLAEYKWDGIRGQVIRRGGQLFVWSRGEELVTDKYPEYEIFDTLLPDGVALDGEIIAWRDDKPLPFAALQTRIGRKTVSKKQLHEAPVVFIAYDLLESKGEDIRHLPFLARRRLLENLIAESEQRFSEILASSHPPHLPLNEALQEDWATASRKKFPLLLSPVVEFETWEELAMQRETATERNAEGLMLKRRESEYRVGRKRGDWWKWKVEPRVIDAVMIYAQQGHGRRANLYTDYTFAVWHDGMLVPFTKAYSGLTDEEIRRVDAWIRKNTLERFGPVRSVKPELVFEIAFEGIQASSRHKSGVALRFPRIARWRTDKKAEEANTLAELKEFLL